MLFDPPPLFYPFRDCLYRNLINFNESPVLGQYLSTAARNGLIHDYQVNEFTAKLCHNAVSKKRKNLKLCNILLLNRVDVKFLLI